MVYLFQSVILWMKIISYHHANRDLRQQRMQDLAVWVAKRSSQQSLSRHNSQEVMFDDNAKPITGKSLVIE